MPYDGDLCEALSCVLIQPSGHRKLAPKLEITKIEEVDICVHNKMRSECTEGCPNLPALHEGGGLLDAAGGWVRWNVDAADVQKTGAYTLLVGFAEKRPYMKAIFDALKLAPVAEKKAHFTVLSGSACHLKIRDCQQAQANVSNVNDQRSSVSKNLLFQRISLQLLDQYENAIGPPDGGLKVAVFIALAQADPRPQVSGCVFDFMCEGGEGLVCLSIYIYVQT